MYILVEKCMNGTFEMGQKITGYNTDLFSDAVKKVKENIFLCNYKILVDESLVFSYIINRDNTDEFPVYGKITHAPLMVID